MPKPKPDHPWKNSSSSRAWSWAYEESKIGKFNTDKRGGGLPPWNTTGRDKKNG